MLGFHFVIAYVRLVYVRLDVKCLEFLMVKKLNGHIYLPEIIFSWHIQYIWRHTIRAWKCFTLVSWSPQIPQKKTYSTSLWENNGRYLNKQRSGPSSQGNNQGPHLKQCTGASQGPGIIIHSSKGATLLFTWWSKIHGSQSGLSSAPVPLWLLTK